MASVLNIDRTTWSPDIGEPAALAARIKTLSRLQALSQLLAEHADFNSILSATWPKLGQLLPAVTGKAILFDAANAKHAVISSDADDSQIGSRQQIEALAQVWQARPGEIVIYDLTEPDSSLPDVAPEGMAVAMAATLWSGAQRSGVLLLFHDDPAGLGPEHGPVCLEMAALLGPLLAKAHQLAVSRQLAAEQAEALASHKAALAEANELLEQENLRRLQISETLAQSLSRTEALNRLSQAIVDFTDLDSLLQTITDEVAANLSAHRVTVTVVDPDYKEILHLVSGGPGAAAALELTIEQLQDTISGLAMRQRTLVNSPKSDDDRVSKAQITHRQERNVGAILSVPILLPHKMHGVITAINMVDQPQFDQEAELLLTAMSAQITVAIENNYLYETLSDQLSLLQRQRNRQSALATIELAINQPHELQQMLDRLVTLTAAELPASAGASIVLWDKENDDFRESSSSIADQPRNTTALRVRRFGGATRWIINEMRPLHVADLAEDQFGANPLMHEHGIKAYAGVPLISGAEALGVLYALEVYEREFKEEDIDFLKAVADRAALAINKVRQNVQFQKLAALEERQRLARDLHDAVSQSLFSANIIAQTLPRLGKSRPDAVAQGLEQLRDLTRNALTEMRALLFELRPDALTEVPLNALLRELLDDLKARSGILASFEPSWDVKLRAEVQVVFYRVAQEAFNNIVKYADAGSVTVSLETRGQRTILEIADDGVGFDKADSNYGHGLKIMVERAESINAQLSINARPGQGTTIRLAHEAVEVV